MKPGSTTFAEPVDRSGVGCPPVDPEILPPYRHGSGARLTIGPVEFNQQTILRSPCFWFLLGAGAAVATYFVLRPRK